MFGTSAGAQTTGHPPIVDGWTALAPSPDSRMIYVSSSSGSDSNTGLSPHVPKRGLAAATALLRDGYPDWLLLKCGDVWYETFGTWNRSGRSAMEPMVIRSYGAGPRPLLRTGRSRAFDLNAPVPRAHLAITDLWCWADTNDGTTGACGVELLNRWTDLLIEGCRFEQYAINISVQGFDEHVRDIRIRRNTVVRSISRTGLSAGILVGRAENILIEENLADHNGWDPQIPGCVPTLFSHNVYVSPGDTSGVVTRRNIVARGAASGLRSAGWLCEENLLLQNPAAVSAGPDCRVIRHNVVLDSRDINAAYPRGLGIDGEVGPGVEIYGNLLAHQVSGTANTKAINLSGNYNGLQVHHNVVYKWAEPAGTGGGAALQLNGSPSTRVWVFDNQFQQPNGSLLALFGPYNPALHVYVRNLYFNSGNALPFIVSPTPLSYPQWLPASGETGSAFVRISYPEPERNVGSYMAAIGAPPYLEAFLNRASQQWRLDWHPEFEAAAVNQYIRDGFGMAGPSRCAGDVSGDNQVDVNDFLVFGSLFGAGDPRADFLPDGVLTVQDVMAFQTAFYAGCP